MTLLSRQTKDFFEKQLAKSLKSRNLVLSIFTGIVLFVAQNLAQSLLLGDTWFLDTYELVVEIALSVVFGLGQFFMWRWQARKRQSKIDSELKKEDYILANYAFYADQYHNYRGILFLKHRSLNFRGNYYSKEKALKIDLDDISNVTLYKVFWLERGIKVLEKKEVERRFITGEASIWIQAIQQETDAISKRDN